MASLMSLANELTTSDGFEESAASGATDFKLVID
jgi:hypothetical protein